MLTRTIVFIGYILLFSQSYANSNDSQSLAQILPQSCHLAGQYRQRKRLLELPRPLESSGHFIFSCDQGLIWHTETPLVETVIYKKNGSHQIIVPDLGAEPLKGRVHRELAMVLNNLIGADTEYLDKHFTITQLESAFSLKPKKKRLRKFILSITIDSSPEGPNISIQHPENQSTDIDIFDTQVYKRINLENCREIFSVQLLACQLLFQ